MRTRNKRSEQHTSVKGLTHMACFAVYAGVSCPHLQKYIVALPCVGWVQAVILLVVQHLCRDVGLQLAVAGRIQQALDAGGVSSGALQEKTHDKTRISGRVKVCRVVPCHVKPTGR